MPTQQATAQRQEEQAARLTVSSIAKQFGSNWEKNPSVPKDRRNAALAAKRLLDGRAARN
ncbi:MAG: hypothetical protein AB7G80_02060 [Dongiaceae bacterium]